MSSAEETTSQQQQQGEPSNGGDLAVATSATDADAVAANDNDNGDDGNQQPVVEEDDAVVNDQEEDDTMPDDLDDFVVLDEAEITESEEGEGGEERGWMSDEEEPKQWDCPAHRLAPRTYSKADLNPTELDPRCKPDWPLAMFWPVYVGNFRLFPKRDTDYHCRFAVQKYFASKGIPAFMVVRLKDDFFEHYQKRVGFFDMLVYFCCQKDAKRAIHWCHRDVYNGHKLNLYDGRTPNLFSMRKSYRFKHLIAEDKLESETNIEQYLSCYQPVIGVSKIDLDGVFIQFTRRVSDWDAQQFSGDPHFQAIPVIGTVQRQRFLEENIERHIHNLIAENPRFIRSRPPFKKLMQFLIHGVIPEMTMPWKNPDEEPAPSRMVLDCAAVKRKLWKNRKGVRRLAGDPDIRPHNTHGQMPGSRRAVAAAEPKSNRDLQREAAILTAQLNRVRHQISERKSRRPNSDRDGYSPIGMDRPRIEPLAGASPPPFKRQRSEAQRQRQRIRGARRRRNNATQIHGDGEPYSFARLDDF